MSDYEFINDQKVLIGISAGINSAAVLCWLKESGLKPSELHLYYAHFEEHYPDSFSFVKDLVRFARIHFPKVVVKISRNSILRYFESIKMILHPVRGLCSFKLKIDPINNYAFKNEIYIDLVGYVRHELERRSSKHDKVQPSLFGLNKHYPVGEFTDEWCFEIVDRNIGWHPKIYDLKWNDAGFVSWLNENWHSFNEGIQATISKNIKRGKSVFNHNNCLPCKNMYPIDLIAIQYFYPEYFEKAMQTSKNLNAHYGRNADEFYTTFGRDLGQESTCNSCKW